MNDPRSAVRLHAAYRRSRLHDVHGAAGFGCAPHGIVTRAASEPNSATRSRSCFTAEPRGACERQVTLAWALQQGYAVIPSSTKRENLASNLLAQSLHLNAQDMAQIATLDRGERLANPAGIAPDWD